MRKLHHCKNGDYISVGGLACSLSREQKCKKIEENYSGTSRYTRVWSGYPQKPKYPGARYFADFADFGPKTASVLRLGSVLRAPKMTIRTEFLVVGGGFQITRKYIRHTDSYPQPGRLPFSPCGRPLVCE